MFENAHNHKFREYALTKRCKVGRNEEGERKGEEEEEGGGEKIMMDRLQW